MFDCFETILECDTEKRMHIIIVLALLSTSACVSGKINLN